MKKRLIVHGQLSAVQLATLEHLFEVTQLSKAMPLDTPTNRHHLAEVHGIIGSGLAITPEFWMQRPSLKSSRLYRWVTTTFLSMN